MTHEWGHHSPLREEAASLRAGMALGITILALVAALLAVTVALLAGYNGPLGRVITSAAALLAVVGFVMRRRPWGPWLGVASVALLLALGILAPDPRIDLLVMATYLVAFFGVLLTSRLWGLAWIAAGVIVMSIVASRSSIRVDVGSWSVNVTSVAVLQMVIAGGWLWWAWHAQVNEAQASDARAARQSAAIEEAVSIQERTRAWRAAITRTHETILNDLRYVLRTPEVDHERLRDQLLTTRDVRARPPDLDRDLADIVEQAAGDFPGTISVAGTGVAVDADTAQTLVAVLVELLRNIARHTDATRVDIEVTDSSSEVRIDLRDNADATSVTGTPGIGRSVVVGDSLAALGGWVEEAPHRTTIVWPRPQAVARAGPAGPALPLLLATVLVGSSVGGSLQFVLLLAGASLTYLPATIAAIAVTVLATVVVVRRHPAHVGAAPAAAALAMVVTWTLALAQPPCAQTPLILTTVNLSLNAVFAVLLLTRSRWAWLVLIPAFSGVLALELLPSVGCGIQSPDALLSSMVLIPFFLLVSWLGARSAARWQREDRSRREREIVERARAEAEVDLAHTLEGSIDHAWDLLWRVADGEPLDEVRRRELRTIESSIRASIQADPRTAGGMVLAAREIVARSTDEGVPVHVRALRGTSDPRPLPPELVDRLASVILDDPDTPSSIHAFTDGVDDYLTLTTTAAVAARAGFVPGWAGTSDGYSVEVEYVGDEVGDQADVRIMVCRASSVTAATPAMVG